MIFAACLITASLTLLASWLFLNAYEKRIKAELTSLQSENDSNKKAIETIESLAKRQEEDLDQLRIRLASKANISTIGSVEEDFRFLREELGKKQDLVSREVSDNSARLKKLREEQEKLSAQLKDKRTDHSPPTAPEENTVADNLEEQAPRASISTPEDSISPIQDPTVIDDATPSTPESQIEQPLSGFSPGQGNKSSVTTISTIEEGNRVRQRPALTPGKTVKANSLDEILAIMNGTVDHRIAFLSSEIEANTFFDQYQDPKNYPIVQMPHPGRDVLLPVNGRKNARGIGEKRFQQDLLQFFANRIKTNFVLPFTNSTLDYEPDFTYHDGTCNLFIDIEIDEPYSGITRKPLHYIGNSDKDRDTYFNYQGWVVIRFTEWQAVCEPEVCCAYIQKVVESLINPEEFDPSSIANIPITLQKQWSYTEAQQMARDKYRESYLGVEFEQRPEEENIIEETYKGTGSPHLNENLHIKRVREAPVGLKAETAPLIEILNTAIAQRKDVRFYYQKREHLVQPIEIISRGIAEELKVFDYVENSELVLDLHHISALSIEENPFYAHEEGSSHQRHRELVELANGNHLYIRIRYQKNSGEISLRTISNFQREYEADGDEWWYSADTYVVGYCHLREERRTFRFNRIQEIWVLNLEY